MQKVYDDLGGEVEDHQDKEGKEQLGPYPLVAGRQGEGLQCQVERSQNEQGKRQRLQEREQQLGRTAF